MCHCTKNKTLLFHEEGAAMVEGAVLVTVFILVFLGMSHLFHVHKANLDAGTKARHCAWGYTQDNCESLPPECKLETNHNPTTEAMVRYQKDLGLSTQSLASHEIPSELGQLTDVLKPVSGFLKGGLGLAKEKVISSKVFTTTPPLLGGIRQSVKQKMAVLCNDKTKTGMQVLQSIWSSVWN